MCSHLTVGGGLLQPGLYDAPEQAEFAPAASLPLQRGEGALQSLQLLSSLYRGYTQVPQ